MFNEAMLDKQEWIMYTNLITTCYKAYLETYILNNQVGTRPSHLDMFGETSIKLNRLLKESDTRKLGIVT